MLHKKTKFTAKRLLGERFAAYEIKLVKFLASLETIKNA